MCGRVTLASFDDMLELARRLDIHANGLDSDIANVAHAWETQGRAVPWGEHVRPGALLPTIAMAALSEPDLAHAVGFSHAAPPSPVASESSIAHTADVSHTANPSHAAPRNASAAPSNVAHQLSLHAMSWGYTLPNDGKLVYNTRIENVQRPFWAASFAYGRAIVPVSSFFEPHHSQMQRNPLTGRMGKRQWRFGSPDGSLMLLAAITQNGRVSIVTTAPNDTVAPVHPRMPLVLSFEEVPTWLEGEWAGLADRSTLALAAEPEHPDELAVEQLSLL